MGHGVLAKHIHFAFPNGLILPFAFVDGLLFTKRFATLAKTMDGCNCDSRDNTTALPRQANLTR